MVYKGRRIDTTVIDHVHNNWNLKHSIWPTSERTGEPRVIESLGISAPAELDACAKALQSVYQMIIEKEI